MPDHEVRTSTGALLGYWEAAWHQASTLPPGEVVEVRDPGTGAIRRCRVLGVATDLWQGSPAEGGVTVTAEEVD